MLRPGILNVGLFNMHEITEIINYVPVVFFLIFVLVCVSMVPVFVHFLFLHVYFVYDIDFK